MAASATFTVASVEAACHAFATATTPEARRQAEAVLLGLRSCADPLAVCTQLVESSALPAAQFHALSALRACVRRDAAWPGAAARTALHGLVVRVLCDGRPLEAYVRGQATQLLALLAKHAVLLDGAAADAADGGGLAAVQARVTELLAAPDGGHAQTGLQLLVSWHS